jgi:peptidoglycan/xylan/chitin deacetylase (PgdA/CDA1 family)
MNILTIVMYHYVRELPLTRYPNIKALLTSQFVEQLNYIEKHYQLVSISDCISALDNRGQSLPKNSALLTFDDGYLDHFTNTFPILEERGIQGCFFPPAKAITEHCVLDVNKIHYILASCGIDALLTDVFMLLDDMRSDHALKSNEDYFMELAETPRYDSKETVFVKRLLQHALPECVRRNITDQLFRKYVTQDEKAFACEIYMSVEQIRCMVRHGMYVGGHGYEHSWMNKLTLPQQVREVDLTLEFLASVGAPTSDWVMCYPYGAHDESLTNLLRAKGCKFGLTTIPDIAELCESKRLTLPRLDTNDLPKVAGADRSKWTKLVVG